MLRRHSVEFIKKSFVDDGYELLTSVYKDNKQRLTYRCPRGHLGSIAWNHYQEGHRCQKCAGVENSIRFRMDFNLIKKNFIECNYVLLTSDYINAHQHLHYICPEGHRNKMTWNNWSKGYRCPLCDDLKHIGPGSCNWKGGISYEPYCEIWKDGDYKKSILWRDDYTCQRCGMTNMLSLLIHGCRLSIHHIDYNKKNCGPNNLITLCLTCNTKANANREHWTAFYKSIIERRLH